MLEEADISQYYQQLGVNSRDEEEGGSSDGSIKEKKRQEERNETGH
jgi:hypothetical protein